MIDVPGLEQHIAQFPVYEYRIISTDTLPVEPRVRVVCKQECERYGTTWACPPGVGELDECERFCHTYPCGLFFSTVAEVRDVLDMEEMLATRTAHEDITNQIDTYLSKQGLDTFVLSTESCDVCEKCAYPDEPCRFPEKMHPCLEGYGIVVPTIVEQEEMEYMLGGNTVLWFSLILLRNNSKDLAI